jgi:hypothetical protein
MKRVDHPDEDACLRILKRDFIDIIVKLTPYKLRTSVK